MEFFSSWYFMGIMAALLIGLIGLLLYLRKQGSED
jgi:cytochrome c biogenesis protein ResB